MEITIDKNGCVKIPKTVLKKLRLKPGTIVHVETSDAAIVLKPAPNDPYLKYVNGVLVYTGKIAGGDEDLVKRHREGRVEELIARTGL